MKHIKLFENKNMKKYTVIIKGDYNDGDYVAQETRVDDIEFELIKKVVKAIKELGLDHNYDVSNGVPYDDYEGILTSEELDQFDNFIPSGGEDGIHSIVSVKFSPLVKWTELL